MCRQKEIFHTYKNFLEELASVASPKLFTNGGKEYASILMSVLLDRTDSIARIFSLGFRPDLISTSPYKEALEKFLKDSNKELRVMVESKMAVNEEPIEMLKKAHNNGNEKISLKIITPKDREEIIAQLGGGHRNFAVFDDDKYRMEYNPEDFQAFGSFNDRATCRRLKGLFDQAFDRAESLL